jgi:hypothetical protein
MAQLRTALFKLDANVTFVYSGIHGTALDSIVTGPCGLICQDSIVFFGEELYNFAQILCQHISAGGNCQVMAEKQRRGWIGMRNQS